MNMEFGGYKVMVVLLLACVACTAAPGLHGLHRMKRGMVQLGRVLYSTTGKQPFFIFNYGCYCGLGGEGSPLDAIDRCCFEHDMCYRRTRGSSFWCRMKLYFSNYSYKCHTENGTTTCSCQSSKASCSGKACACDMQLSHCLRDNMHSYNNSLVNVNSTSCDPHV